MNNYISESDAAVGDSIDSSNTCGTCMLLAYQLKFIAWQDICAKCLKCRKTRLYWPAVAAAAKAAYRPKRLQ